jgi:late competence protein required for DNA uptake (superfamily II DNA/RNA helicase)
MIVRKSEIQTQLKRAQLAVNIMIISETPWECPRCNSWLSPKSLKCDCKPIKRDYCLECLTDAFAMFNSPFPSLDIIHAYAENLHLNYAHRNNNDN